MDHQEHLAHKDHLASLALRAKWEIMVRSAHQGLLACLESQAYRALKGVTVDRAPLGLKGNKVIRATRVWQAHQVHLEWMESMETEAHLDLREKMAKLVNKESLVQEVHQV